MTTTGPYWPSSASIPEPLAVLALVGSPTLGPMLGDRPEPWVLAPLREWTMQPTDLVDHQTVRDDVPDFAAGDSVKVHVRVVEGNRQRVQVFEGVVIARRGSGVSESFTVRKVSFAVGVERTFPLHSPIIERIEVMSRGDVSRAKLYYLRDRVGKKAKIREKREV